MKKSTKVIIASVLGISVITAGVTAFARHAGYGWHHHEHRAEHIAEHVGDWLELDRRQEVKLTQTLDELFAFGRDFKAQNSIDRQALINLLEQPQLDQATLLAMVNEKIQTVSDSAPNLVASIADFTDSLDAVQKRQLTDKLSRRMARRWSRD